MTTKPVHKGSFITDILLPFFVGRDLCGWRSHALVKLLRAMF